MRLYILIDEIHYVKILAQLALNKSIEKKKK